MRYIRGNLNKLRSADRYWNYLWKIAVAIIFSGFPEFQEKSYYPTEFIITPCSPSTNFMAVVLIDPEYTLPERKRFKLVEHLIDD